MSYIRTPEHRMKMSLLLKGRIPWHKGRTGVYSQETLNKMRIAQLGHPVSEEARKKIAEAGRNRSYEARQKISRAHKGRKMSAEWIEKIRQSRIGRRHSPDTIAKMCIAQKGHAVSAEARRKIGLASRNMSEEARRKIGDATISRILSGHGFKDTKPERMMRAELDANGIAYKHPHYIKIARVVVDFFIEPNIVVECDGIYWHSRPGRKEIDAKRTRLMIEGGYRVYRFTDKEIYKNIHDCVEEIKKGL